jgi:hypothetical protein
MIPEASSCTVALYNAIQAVLSCCLELSLGNGCCLVQPLQFNLLCDEKGTIQQGKYEISPVLAL